MEWIIGILAALVAVLLIILAVYKRQIRDICRQLAFLKEYDSNLLITRQMDAFGIRELTDELNEMLERQREQRRRYLKKEQDISDAYTNLSHDIRTPLTSILGAASGILENYGVLEDGEKRRLIGDMKKEAQWLIRIVENLLSITRISGNGEGARIHTAEEVMEEVIGDAVGKFRGLYPGMRVEVEMPPEALIVPMDGILIEQVLMNLMENSVQHGGGVEEIRIVVAQEEGGVTTAVEDDGNGISRSVLPVIFEGRLSGQGQEGGDSRRNMGIGLSVCMSIVKAHGGSMKAENREEGGARVSFWLPMEEEGSKSWKSGTEF